MFWQCVFGHKGAKKPGGLQKVKQLVIEGSSKKLSVNISEKQRISREDSYQGCALLCGAEEECDHAGAYDYGAQMKIWQGTERSDHGW